MGSGGESDRRTGGTFASVGSGEQVRKQLQSFFANAFIITLRSKSPKKSSLSKPPALRNASDSTVAQAVLAALNPFQPTKEAIDSATIYVLAVKELVQLPSPTEFKPNSFIKNLIPAAQTPTIRHKLQSLHTLLGKSFNSSEDDIYYLSRLCPSGQTNGNDATLISLWYFIKYHQTPARGLATAVSAGGLASTVGSMVGALLGALCGTQWIATIWNEKLENREEFILIEKKIGFGSDELTSWNIVQ